MAKMKKRTKIILIVVAIVVIAAIGAGVWYWNKKKKEAEAENGDTKEQPDKTVELELSDDKKKVTEQPPEEDTKDFDINDIENRIREKKSKSVAEEALDPEIKVSEEQTALKTAKVAQEDLKKTKMQS